MMRELFPQLQKKVRGHRLVYLDSAATTLKPEPVIRAVSEYLSFEVANVHRGAHYFSDRGTERFESARELVRGLLGAESAAEIVFTKGTTEGINLLARSLGGFVLKAGDEILVSQMDHHSNIVPWQMIAREKGAVVRFIPVMDDGTLDFAAYRKMLSPKVRIVSLAHLSNALGTVNPLAKFFNAARAVGAVTVADAAQSVSAMSLNVRDLDCDFLVFSGHKVFGPTGVGVLYGRLALLETMPPYQGGGSMISTVTEEGVEFLAPPHRFEAGTPPIAEVIGLAAALEFLRDVGFQKIQAHEKELSTALDAGLSSISGLRRIGTAADKMHVSSFVLEGAHPSDVGSILDEQGIAVRAGHHCCQPLMKRFGIPGTVRASLSIYSTMEDVESLLSGIKKAKELLL